MTTRMKLAACVAALCAGSAAYTARVFTQAGSGTAGEWRDYGGDKGFTKYSPLDQINKDNISRLRIAWRRPAVAEELRAQNPSLTVANNLRSTPLMVGGVLYASNGIGLVEAFDATTGKTVWVQEFDGELRGGAPTRGIAYWGSGADARILVGARTGSLRDRSEDRQAHSLLRRQRPRRPAAGHGAAGDRLRVDQLSAGVQRRGHHRRFDDRFAAKQGRTARASAGVRRAKRQAALGVQSDSAARRSGQRDLGKRLMGVQRRGERLDVDEL